MHSGYWTSIFGKNHVYYIQIFTVKWHLLATLLLLFNQNLNYHLRYATIDQFMQFL